MKVAVELNRLWRRGIPRAILVVTSTTLWFACNEMPSGVSMAPKIIEADGAEYIACEGFVNVYEPSRGVADSSQKIYEITFIDDYRRAQDLKGIKSYTIRGAERGEVLAYAMPAGANPSNNSTTYSDGKPIQVGAIVTFGDSGGKAKWLGPGKWQAVPCSF